MKRFITLTVATFVGVSSAVQIQRHAALAQQDKEHKHKHVTVDEVSTTHIKTLAEGEFMARTQLRSEKALSQLRAQSKGASSEVHGHHNRAQAANNALRTLAESRAK
jgi:hypothetical protein